MVDIPKFAKKAGLTAGSAKNVLIKIRKKLDDGENAAGVDATSPLAEGKMKKAPAKESPEKKPRAPRNKEAKVQAMEEDEEVHDLSYGFLSLTVFTAVAYQIANRLVVSSAPCANGKEQDGEQRGW